MRRNPIFVAYAGPFICTFVGILCFFVRPAHVWSLIPLGLALLTAPLWPLAALKEHGEPDARADIVESLNFQLTIIAALAVGGVLLLFFVGLFVLVGAVFVELIASFTAAWRIRSGEVPGVRVPTIRFVK